MHYASDVVYITKYQRYSKTLDLVISFLSDRQRRFSIPRRAEKCQNKLSENFYKIAFVAISLVSFICRFNWVVIKLFVFVDNFYDFFVTAR